MADGESQRGSRIFVVVNPSSGNCTPDDIKGALARHLGAGTGPEYRIHELSEGDDLGGVARGAAGEGYDVVVAAGGDGTVSAVANGLLGSGARLGIIPLGTTNVLARELGVPIELEGACRLLAGPNRYVWIDGMKLGGTVCFTQIGIGVDAYMIRDTTVENKKRFGALAYLWTAARHAAGFNARRFTVVVDGVTVKTRAIQVLLVNCGTLGTSGLRWGPDIRADDGRVDVCIVRANRLLDYAAVAWSMIRGRQREDRNIRYVTAERSVAVKVARSLPVQADGEVVGETPLELTVVREALRVVVPPTADGPTAGGLPARN